MIKKITLIVALLLTGCSLVKEPENTNYSEIFMEENSKTALEVINQAYSDLNNRESLDLTTTLYQRNIIVPVDLSDIPMLETIDQCQPLTDQHSNAAFIGICPINDKYQAQIKIFDLNEDFWSSGEITIQYITIPNGSEYQDVIDIATPLLDNRQNALDLLFGYTSVCLNDTEDSLTCLVTDDQQQGIDYLNVIKSTASSIFSQEFLADYETILYNSNTAVWKLDEQGLHLTLVNDMLTPAFQYEINTIGAVSNSNNLLTINCCVSYMNETVNDVHEIQLIDEGEGYRILSLN